MTFPSPTDVGKSGACYETFHRPKDMETLKKNHPKITPWNFFGDSAVLQDTPCIIENIDATNYFAMLPIVLIELPRRGLSIVEKGT